MALVPPATIVRWNRWGGSSLYANGHETAEGADRAIVVNYYAQRALLGD